MFVELHAQSAFSFLEGAEQPEVLATEAARLDMPALALVDRDGVYGAPRFHRAALAAGIKALVGSEITLTDGSRLPLLVEDREGYVNLCRLVTRMKLGAPKGAGAVTLGDLAPAARGLVRPTGRGPRAPGRGREGARHPRPPGRDLRPLELLRGGAATSRARAGADARAPGRPRASSPDSPGGHEPAALRTAGRACRGRCVHLHP